MLCYNFDCIEEEKEKQKEKEMQEEDKWIRMTHVLVHDSVIHDLTLFPSQVLSFHLFHHVLLRVPLVFPLLLLWWLLLLLQFLPEDESQRKLLTK